MNHWIYGCEICMATDKNRMYKICMKIVHKLTGKTW